MLSQFAISLFARRLDNTQTEAPVAVAIWRGIRMNRTRKLAFCLRATSDRPHHRNKIVAVTRQHAFKHRIVIQ